MKNVKELDIIEMDMVAGGNDPDLSQFIIFPWDEVVEFLKDYVRYFKDLDATYERALRFIEHTIDNPLSYQFTWFQDANEIRKCFTELWNTYGTW